MKAQALVWKRGETWHYEVYDSTGKVVLADNTNNWRKIFDLAFFDVRVTRRVEGAGHKFEYNYWTLVDRVKL